MLIVRIALRFSAEVGREKPVTVISLKNSSGKYARCHKGIKMRVTDKYCACAERLQIRRKASSTNKAGLSTRRVSH